MKRVYANEAVCIGCRLCEVYCSVQHSPSRDIIRTFKRSTPPAAAIRVHEEGALSFAVQCRHCEEPACLEACLTGAMWSDEHGIVRINSAQCIGCWTCMLACPYGAIGRNEATRKSVKCDLCASADVPACVSQCPNGALVWSESPLPEVQYE